MFLFVAMIRYIPSFAQAPKLPPTNLGLSNMQDGNPPGTGWFFQQYEQLYQSDVNKDGLGNTVNGPHISSMLSLSQLIFMSTTKVAGGNLGFTVLVPVVKISATGAPNTLPTINPDPLGDMIAGPFIQWFNRRLFKRPLAHRLEFDAVAPVGAYQRSYMINAGSHMVTIVPHYTLTFFPTDKFSISMRHMLSYNFDEIGTGTQAGMFYNFNYAFEYAITKSVRVELAGYYLTQLVQDANDGNYHYYQDMYNIPDTRERFFAYGPGIGYVTPSHLFLELKNMWEAGVKNNTQGFRTTLVLAYKLDK